MSDTYKNLAQILGGVLVGGFMVFTFTVNGQVIEIADDGVTEKEELVVTKMETKEVVIYSQTLSEANNNLTQAYLERDRLNANITKWEAEKAEMQTELDKLPEREEVIPE